MERFVWTLWRLRARNWDAGPRAEHSDTDLGGFGASAPAISRPLSAELADQVTKGGIAGLTGQALSDWLCLFRQDPFECPLLRFHADMGVVLQHLLRDVSGNVPDGFVTRAAFGTVGNQGVPVIVPPPRHLRSCVHLVPRTLKVDRRPDPLLDP